MIVFFPTYARRLPDERRWRATVAGMVTRPLPAKSRRRAMAVAVLKRLLDLDEEQSGSEVFQRRADAFFFQRVAGQPVRIAVGDRLVDAGQTDRSGHFEASFDLDEADVAPASAAAPAAALPAAPAAALPAASAATGAAASAAAGAALAAASPASPAVGAELAAPASAPPAKPEVGAATGEEAPL